MRSWNRNGRLRPFLRELDTGVGPIRTLGVFPCLDYKILFKLLHFGSFSSLEPFYADISNQSTLSHSFLLLETQEYSVLTLPLQTIIQYPVGIRLLGLLIPFIGFISIDQIAYHEFYICITFSKIKKKWTAIFHILKEWTFGWNNKIKIWKRNIFTILK